jgi:hypothetical protein
VLDAPSKLLLPDDEADLRESLDEILSVEGYRITGWKDWNALESLCAEQVRFAGPQGLRFSATLVGREALRKHSQETFAIFRDAKFRELVCYQTPGGVAVRYLGTWTRDGVPVQQAGTALLQIESGRIQRIGVEMNRSLLDRLAPS